MQVVVGATVPCVDLLRAAAEHMDTGALGGLVACVSQLCFEGSRKRTLQLILAAGLEEQLFDPEFVEGVGAKHLKTKQLLSLAFSTAAGPGEAMRKVLSLLAAGALHITSDSAIAELHRGIRTWYAIEARAEFVARVASEFDTFAEAGHFLHLFASSPSSHLDSAETVQLLRLVVRHREVRDLAGNRRDLLSALSEWRDEIEAADEDDEEGGGSDSDSDADEEGNLAGFITYSDSEEEEGDGDGDGDDASDKGSDDGRGSGSEEEAGAAAAPSSSAATATAASASKTGAAAAAAAAAAVRARKAQMLRRMSEDSAGSSHGDGGGGDGGGGGGGAGGKGGRKRLRPQGSGAAATSSSGNSGSAAWSSALGELGVEVVVDSDEETGGGAGHASAPAAKRPRLAEATEKKGNVKKQSKGATDKKADKARERAVARYFDMEAGMGKRER